MDEQKRLKVLSGRLAADASQELNMKELGFKSREDFEAKDTEAYREALERMWQ